MKAVLLAWAAWAVFCGMLWLLFAALHAQGLPQPDRTIISGTTDYVCVAYDTEQSKRNLSCASAGSVREFIITNGTITDEEKP